MNEVVAMINKARNPTLVFGSEIDQVGAFREAVEFAHQLKIPVYAEPMSSRGCYPSDDPLFQGDLPFSAKQINEVLSENDLVAIIGGDLTIYPFSDEILLKGKTVVNVGTVASGKIGTNYFMNPRLFLEYAKNLVKKKILFLLDDLKE